MSLLTDLAAQIPDALTRLADVTRPTPVHLDPRLTKATGSQIWLKREDLQPVRSYKLRGAYNLMAQLSPEEKAAGVVCASAGNHAQGVAYSAAALGVRATIVVPLTTPRQKRDRIQDLGDGFINLVYHGATYDAASEEATRLAVEEGMAPVPAFNDPRTAAGQGTIIVEAIEQLGFVPDVVVLPIGGGGLVAGVSAWLRTHHPEVRIVGVEPEGAPCMAAAISAGHPVTLKEIDTFVDGAAVRRAGDFTFEVVREAGIELTRVPEGQICTEMLAMYQTDGIIAEPAGALAAAALPTGGVGPRVAITPGSRVLVLVSGGNNDVSRYGEIVERSLIHEGRKRYFLIEFPQQPGALRSFLDSVLGPEDDITFFEYIKRNNRDTGPALVGVELGNPSDYRFLVERIEASGMEAHEVAYDSPYFQFLV
ncbi:threonine ammonia-lyase IlvA [Tessaracoccus palaemonis]|uniref:L-threonine dehydratase n=1 Tax=Tessaracoccus palaemonis TaxID=2829499 RepID=A0ABX8SKV1_9ACTN|nr:threonine ammonia-lyase IlvA [Tessaracoccus palaemonis]QXT63514.1 threonine ammonia-lyase IlvA [Tessaracoccus palaemonis]